MVWFSCTLTSVIVPSQWPCERSTAGRHASRATACTHLSEPGMASTGGRACRESASVLLRFLGIDLLAASMSGGNPARLGTGGWGGRERAAVDRQLGHRRRLGFGRTVLR